MNEFTAAAMSAAKTAGQMLKEGQTSPLDIQFKGEVDLVTRMDKQSEKFITGFLREQFPYHNIVAEEGTQVHHESGYVWYVDPLDGTTNYAHGLPWYAVSIALFLDGSPISAVVHNPANGELFYGEKGKGSFLNDERITVSPEGEMIKSLLVTGFPYYTGKTADARQRIVAIFNGFLSRCQGIRRFGSAALDLCSVACGRYEGYWEEGLKPWDTGAGILIASEAGARITTYEGKDYGIFEKTIVASNGKIHDGMLAVISERIGEACQEDDVR